MVTKVVDCDPLVTVFPALSFNVTTGWLLKIAPLAAVVEVSIEMVDIEPWVRLIVCVAEV
jgi:hypothetical protein